MDNLSFPPNFVWGASTSAFQIEGAWNEGGKGESNWDRWCHTPNKIKGGGTGDVAVDHYHRWREDVQLMREIGLSAYRLSIAWSRVQPDGRGQLNPKGLAFYDSLIDALREAGIQPFVTLCHYDIPQVLEDRGGWLNREMTDWFAEYAQKMACHYGDRVEHWITINEPVCIAKLGYAMTVEPPGLGDLRAGAQASHHLLLAHGKALQAVKAVRGNNHQLGLVCNLYPIKPHTTHKSTDNRSNDLALRMTVGTDAKTDGTPATEEDMSDAVRLADGYINRWWLDPMYRGSYPQDIWDDMEYVPTVRSGDMEIIGTRPDFLGVNYYNHTVVRPVRCEGKLTYASVPAKERGAAVTSMGWEISPAGLYELLVRLKADYENPSVYITENGMAQNDIVAEDNAVHDDYRIAFLQDHLHQAARCLAEDVNLKGYFVWSLLDNFEWEAGWGQRFGLLYVDYDTLNRTIKDSGRWYRDFIASHRNSVCRER